MPEPEELLAHVERGETLKNGTISFNYGFGWYYYDELWIKKRGSRHDWGTWELNVTKLQPVGSLWQQDWWVHIYLERLRRAGTGDPMRRERGAGASQIAVLIEPGMSSSHVLKGVGEYGNFERVLGDGKHLVYLDDRAREEATTLLVYLAGPIDAVPR